MGATDECRMRIKLQRFRTPGDSWKLVRSGMMRASWDVGACTRLRFAFSLGVVLWALPLTAQQRSQSLDDKYPENPTPQETAPSRSARLERLPIEWIIGPYVPVQERLKPLTNSQREQIYVRQTFPTAGSYVARAFQRELTTPAVNLTIGEAGLLAAGDATQPGTESL